MSKIIRRTVGTKKEIGAALVLAQTGNSVEFFGQKPNLFRKLRPGVSVVESKHGNPMQIRPAPGSAPSRHEPELTASRLFSRASTYRSRESAAATESGTAVAATLAIRHFC